MALNCEDTVYHYWTKEQTQYSLFNNYIPSLAFPYVFLAYYYYYHYYLPIISLLV